MRKIFEKTISESADAPFRLNEDNSRHIGGVLRLRPGDEIVIGDGAGTDFICAIERIDKKAVYARRGEKIAIDAEPPVYVALYQCMPKSDKMDIIIQKCVELGVSRIVPVISERSVSRPESAAKLARYNKISEGAARQSGRGIIPEIAEFCGLERAIASAKELDGAVASYEMERDTGLKSYLAAFRGKSLGVFVGPEGGFSAQEAALMSQNGAVPVSLGKRILRSETAGLYVMSCVNYELFG